MLLQTAVVGSRLLLDGLEQPRPRAERGGRFARAQFVAQVERRAGWDLDLRQPANRYATLVGGAYVALAVTAGISARAAHMTGAQRVAPARAAVDRNRIGLQDRHKGAVDSDGSVSIDHFPFDG